LSISVTVRRKVWEIIASGSNSSRYMPRMAYSSHNLSFIDAAFETDAQVPVA
jgi:hypothetical protein